MTLTCSKCKETKETSEFHKNKRSTTGFHNQCKICRSGESKEQKLNHYYANRDDYAKRAKTWKVENRDRWNEYCQQYRASDNFTYKTPAVRANRAKSRAAKIQATPSWSDFEKINAIYQLCHEINKTSDLKFEVDHIHPIQGKTFTGLHVWFNLMILPATLNQRKGNKLLKNIMSPRVLDNFDEYLSELKMYAELTGKQL